MSDDKIPYYKIGKLRWNWNRREGEDGCKIVREVQFSINKAPPPLPDELKPKAAPESLTPKPPNSDSAVNMINDNFEDRGIFSRFKTRLNTPDSLKRPLPAVLEKAKPVPPFDIQEIPDAMRKQKMPIGAKLMERWFAGELNYSPTQSDESAEINQDGKPYPSEVYDMTTGKLDWVLKFSRARKKYEHLINDAVRSEKSRGRLIEKLTRFKHDVELHTTDICGDDFRRLHTLFQFQYIQVDGTLAEKLALQLLTSARNTGAPDDLTAALGAFNIYAAIGRVRFTRDVGYNTVLSRTTKAEITGVWVYVKDGYTFTDRQGERSQYLGHWSSEGVIAIPLDGIAARSRYIPYQESSVVLPYINVPVSIDEPTIKGKVYYPIHNSDFRQWAIKHQRGGDFVVFSDRRLVPVVPPITVYL
jgi:hypothetical protein